MIDWSFDAWPAVEPHWHPGATPIALDREFHVDLGCGTVKKGRIGIDRYPAPGVNVVMDLDKGLVAAMAPEQGRDAADLTDRGWRYYSPGRGGVEYLDYPSAAPEFGQGGYRRRQGGSEAYGLTTGLPFSDGSIESMISHHALEHIGEGFIPLMDDIYRVLKPGGVFVAITPLFPSDAAVGDPDHCRYFTRTTWLAFCGHLGSADNPTGSWLDSFSVPYTKARFEMLDQWTSPGDDEIRVVLKAVKWAVK